MHTPRMHAYNAQVMHLYTYDIFCEKLGYKIAWGCTAWCFMELCTDRLADWPTDRLTDWPTGRLAD